MLLRGTGYVSNLLVPGLIKLSVYGLKRTRFDHSMFVRHGVKGIVILAVYLDGIVLTRSDVQGINALKVHLGEHFHMKVLGKTTLFFGH